MVVRMMVESHVKARLVTPPHFSYDKIILQKKSVQINTKANFIHSSKKKIIIKLLLVRLKQTSHFYLRFKVMSLVPTIATLFCKEGEATSNSCIPPT